MCKMKIIVAFFAGQSCAGDCGLLCDQAGTCSFVLIRRKGREQTTIILLSRSPESRSWKCFDYFTFNKESGHVPPVMFIY